jgi:hypothetical protein
MGANDMPREAVQTPAGAITFDTIATVVFLRDSVVAARTGPEDGPEGRR